MKQKLFFLSILILCIQQKTWSQAPPCKYGVNDGKTIITDSSGGWILHGYVQMVRSGNDYKMHMKYVGAIDPNSPAYKILKGQAFKLILKNKDTVSLGANEMKMANVTNLPQHRFACYIEDDYSISATDVKRILASPCLGIEINLTSNDGTPRNEDFMHPMFHNEFINLLNCTMK